MSLLVAAEKRVALVAGNSASRNIARLDNPSNDATLMADTLSSLGFTLIGERAQLDLDKAALDTGVHSFARLNSNGRRREASPTPRSRGDRPRGVAAAISTASPSSAAAMRPAAAAPERSGAPTDAPVAGPRPSSKATADRGHLSRFLAVYELGVTELARRWTGPRSC